MQNESDHASLGTHAHLKQIQIFIKAIVAWEHKNHITK